MDIISEVDGFGQTTICFTRIRFRFLCKKQGAARSHNGIASRSEDAVKDARSAPRSGRRSFTASESEAIPAQMSVAWHIHSSLAFSVGFPFLDFRIEAPARSMRCALWTRRSRILSASVGSPI